MNGSSMVVNARMPAIKDYDIGLRHGSYLPSFFNKPVCYVIVCIQEDNPLSQKNV